MRALALPFVLLLLAGCSSSPPAPLAETADEGRAGRGSSEIEALVVAPGSPFAWRGSTDACTGIEMPSSCTGQSLDGSETTRIAVAEGLAGLRLTVSWTPDSDASQVLDLVVYDGTGELARASGPSPLALELPKPPEVLRVVVQMPDPDAARLGDGTSQMFEGLAEAVA